MALGDVDAFFEVEHQTVHPLRAQQGDVGQLRVGLEHIRREHRGELFTRYRRDVPVRGDLPWHPAGADDGRGLDVPAVGGETGQCLTDAERHTLRTQVVDPRVEPLRAGRAVEYAVESLVVGVVSEEQDRPDRGFADESDRMCARVFGFRCGKVADDAVGEVSVVLRRLPVRAEVVLPRHVLPLPEFAFGAAGDVDGELLRRVDRFPRRQLEQRLEHRRDGVDERLRGDRIRDHRQRERERDRQVVASEPGVQIRRRAGQVVPGAVSVAGERNSPHRVGDVAVEAGEESEAVFGGQRCRTGVGYGDRSGLATERLALVHGHGVAALDEFVSGGESRDARSEHRDRLARRCAGRRRNRHQGGRGGRSHHERPARQPSRSDPTRHPATALFADPRRRNKLTVILVTTARDTPGLQWFGAGDVAVSAGVWWRRAAPRCPR